MQTYLSLDPVSHDGGFASSFVTQGSQILLGSKFSQLSGVHSSGAAYLLDAATGNVLQTYLHPTPVQHNFFGEQVAFAGNDKVVIGSGHDEFYILDRSSGALLQTIQNPSGVIAGGVFGERIVADGNNILVSDYRFKDGEFAASGIAYLFDATSGDLLQTFLNPTPALVDLFGNGVAIQGNKVLVGANGDDTFGINTGAAYLFDATTGGLIDTFLGTSPGDGGFAGVGKVAFLGEDRVIVGDIFNDTGAAGAGAVFVFDVVPEPSMLMLSATAAVCLLGYGWRRR